MLTFVDVPLLFQCIHYLVFLNLYDDIVAGLLVSNQDLRPDEFFKLVLRHVGDRIPELSVRLLGVCWVFKVYRPLHSQRG